LGGGAPITIGTLTAQPVGPFSVTANVPPGGYTIDTDMTATLCADVPSASTVPQPTLTVTGNNTLGAPANIVVTATPVGGGTPITIGTLTAQQVGPFSVTAVVPAGSYTTNTVMTVSALNGSPTAVPPSALTVTGNNTLGVPANVVVTATPVGGGCPITIGTLTSQPVGPFSVTANVPPGGYTVDTNMTATLCADVPSASTVPQPTLTVTGNNTLGAPANIVVTAIPVGGGTPITIGTLAAQPVGPFSVTAVVPAGSYTTDTVMTVSALNGSPTAVPPSALTVTANNALGVPANIVVTATPVGGGCPITIGTLTAQPVGPFSVTADVPPGGYTVDTNMTATICADVPSASTVPQPTLTVTGNNTLGAPANIVVTATPVGGGTPITIGTMTAQPVGPLSVTAVVPAGSYTTDVSMAATLSASAVAPATVPAPCLPASTFPALPPGATVITPPPMPAAGVGQIGAVSFQPISAATPACTVTFAHPFGDAVLPAGSGLTIGGLPAQVNAFKHWPDGSVRHAGIAIAVPAMATTQWAVGMMVAGTGAAGSNVALAADPTTVTVTNTATQVQLASVNVTAAIANAPGGTGSGGSITATISGGVVQSLTIVNCGSGRTPGTYNLEFLLGGGSGAAGTYTVNPSGAIASTNLTSCGSGYTAAPTVRIPSVSYLRQGPLVTEGRVRIAVPGVSPEFELVVDLACFGDGVTPKRMDIGYCRELSTITTQTGAATYGPTLLYDTTITVNGTPTTYAAVGAVVLTSSTSATIGTGSHTFTVSSGMKIVNGAAVYIAPSKGSPNYMLGTVTSYSGTSLVVNITATGGSGTFSSWATYSSGHDLYQIWHQVVNEDLVHVIFDTGLLRATGAMIHRTDIGVACSAITSNCTLALEPFVPLGNQTHGTYLNGVTLYMPCTGDRPDLGVTTMANTCWLIMQDPTRRQVALSQAEAASSIPWHYRDATTGKYLWVEDWPAAYVINSGTRTAPQYASYGAAWTVDFAHPPNCSSWPWMLTGRRKWWDDCEAIAASAVTTVNPGTGFRKLTSTFTATGSGTTLHVTTTPSNPIWPGCTLTGTGVPAGTVVISQASGTQGGIGCYTTNNATTSSGASLTATSYYIVVWNTTTPPPARQQAWSVRELLWGAYLPDASALTHLVDGTAAQANLTQIYTASAAAVSTQGQVAIWNGGATNEEAGRFALYAMWEEDYFILVLGMAYRMGYANANSAAALALNLNAGEFLQTLAPGSGASIMATVSGGAVTSLTIAAAGANYPSGTYALAFSGGGGSGAVGTFTVNSSGVVASAALKRSGTGYTTSPTISLVPAFDPYWAVLYCVPMGADQWGNPITTWAEAATALFDFLWSAWITYTISGTVGSGGPCVTFTFTSPDLNSGTAVSVVYMEGSGDTTPTLVATHVAAAINGTTSLYNYGVYAVSSGATVKISYPAVVAGSNFISFNSTSTTVTAGSLTTTATNGGPPGYTITQGAYMTQAGDGTAYFETRFGALTMGVSMGHAASQSALNWFNSHPDTGPGNVTQVSTSAFMAANPRFVAVQ